MDKCSFCGKSREHGVRLVQGPSVAMCDECVTFMHDDVVPNLLPVAERNGGSRLELFPDSNVADVRPPVDE